MALAGHDPDGASPAKAARAPESMGLWAGRVAGAGLLVWIGWIHLHLWDEGYRHIATVGPLFMANFVATIAAALVLLAAPNLPLVAATALAGACVALGTLGGLLISIHVGLFGFTDSWSAPFAHLSLAVEVAAAVVLLATAGGAVWVRAARGSRRDG